jgi:hypothetical protein
MLRDMQLASSACSFQHECEEGQMGTDSDELAVTSHESLVMNSITLAGINESINAA